MWNAVLWMISCAVNTPAGGDTYHCYTEAVAMLNTPPSIVLIDPTSGAVPIPGIDLGGLPGVSGAVPTQ